MKVKCKLLNQDAKRGTQKKRERANTNTTHLVRNGKTLERQGKRTAEADGKRNQTSGGGGGRKRLNQPNMAKPKPTSARAGPNLPEGRRTQEHMRKGTHGGQIDEDASTCHARFVIRLKGPRLSCQNPLDSLSSQPLNYMHN